jgi:hypothetical protein
MTEAAAGPSATRTTKRSTSTPAAAAAKTARPAKVAAPATKKTSPSPAKPAPARPSGTRTTGAATKTTGIPAKRAATTAKSPATPAKRAVAKTAGTPAKRAATKTTGAAAKTTATPAPPKRTTAVRKTTEPKPSSPRTPRTAAPSVPQPVTERERIFTPSRPVADESRPRASTVISELWLEREELSRATTPATTPEPAVEARGPRPSPSDFMSGKGGLVAAIVAVAVLLGGAVGVFLARGGADVPTKATFIAKSDAVCQAANSSIAAISKPTSYPELATAIGTVATADDAQGAGLARVHLPKGTAGTAAADVIASLTTTSQAAHSLAEAAAKKDDAATATATSHLMTQYADAATKARAFGFTACATGMQTGMDNVTGGAKGLVKATFTAKADGLCREASRKLDAIPPFKANATDVARFFGQGLAITTKTVADLRTLAPPPGDEAAIADMLAAQDKFNAKLGELRDAAAAGDQSRFVAAGHELDVLSTAADSKFDAYGLSVCGSNFGES